VAFGARKVLREALDRALPVWQAWQVADRRAAAAQADYRVVREEIVAAAGGLVVASAGRGLQLAAVTAGSWKARKRAHRAAAERLARARVIAAEAAEEAAAARREFLDVIGPAVIDAVDAGVPLVAVMRWTGLRWSVVSELVTTVRPNAQVRNRFWDPVFTGWMRWLSVLHPAGRLWLPNGESVSVRWLREQMRAEGVTVERLVELGVDPRVAGLIGVSREPVFDLSDGHFHHIGYDDPRGTSILGFLQKLADAGHQGVLTFHPIPQRGKGVASTGGTFYYAIANALTLGLVFKVPMLQMWGTFPDVRLVDAVRRLPLRLAWRAVMGVTGARLDIAGAEGYLQLMAMINPDLAVLVGETTIAKEAVRDLLGDEGIHILNPEWERQIRRVITAVGILRGVSAAAAVLPDFRQVEPAEVIGRLLGEVDTIKRLLVENGFAAEADQLLSVAELKRLPVHNPHVAELLKASQDIGYLVVLHNDWGLARILADGRFGEHVPDERFGMPLLAVLKQYPRAKVILAHLGVGKWTTLSVEHLELIGRILDDPDYAHVSFDISWNEVARHLQATPEITEAFLQLVRRHPTRIVFGSDAVKPESLPQYYRHAHDMERIFQRIRDEIGLDAYHNVRHDNLERLLAAARADVQRWAYVQWSSGMWDGFLRRLDPDRQAVIRRWISRYEVTVAAPTPQQRAAIELVDPAEVLDPTRPGVEQAQNLLNWTAAVNHRVTSGRLISFKLIAASIKAARDGAKALRAKQAERAAAERAAREGLRLATDAAALDLVDRDGAPMTVEALIAGHQSLLATGDKGVANRVVEQVQHTELAQRRDNAAIATLRTRYLRLTVLAAGVTVAALAAGAYWLLPLAPVAAGWAFAIRGALNAHRAIYATQLRVMTESILERGQFDRDTLRHLITVIGKYAALDRTMPAWRLSKFDRLARQVLVDAEALIEAPRGPTETAQSRLETSLKEFSIFLDKAGSIFGVQAQSMFGFSPHSGLLGQTVTTVLAGTWLVNFVLHAAGTLTALATANPLGIAVNATYAIADALFLVQALPAMIAGWVGYDPNLAPRIRAITQAWAMPMITVANFLFSLHVAFVEHSLLAIAGVGLTVASAYLSWLGIAAELRLGRIAPRKGVYANLALAAGLIVFGVAAVAPTTGWPLLLAVTTASATTMWGLARIDDWRAHKRRGPPTTPTTTRDTRDATDADLARITAEAIVNPNGHGAVLVAPGDRLRAYAQRLHVTANQVTVVIHGDHNGFRYLIDDVEVRLTATQLAHILNHLNLQPHSELILCACSTGAHTNGPAHDLAHATGRPIIAATGTVTVQRSLLGARADTDQPWRRFTTTHPANTVPTPPTLTNHTHIPNTQPLSPTAHWIPVEPHSPPVQAEQPRDAGRQSSFEAPRAGAFGVTSPGLIGLGAAPAALPALLSDADLLSLAIGGFGVVVGAVTAIIQHRLRAWRAARSERRADEALPVPPALPPPWPAVSPTGPAGPLNEVTDEAGRRIAQDPRLGLRAHPVVARTVAVVVTVPGGFAMNGTGVLYRLENGSGVVLTNSHVLAPPPLPRGVPNPDGRIEVHIATADGVIVVAARRRPVERVEVEAHLVLAHAIRGLDSLRVGSVDLLDVAVLEVDDPRLTGVVFPPMDLARPPTPGTSVAWMGHPDVTLGVRDRDGRPTLSQPGQLVAVVGAVEPLSTLDPTADGSLFFQIDDERAEQGASGGPVVELKTGALAGLVTAAELVDDVTSVEGTYSFIETRYRSTIIINAVVIWAVLAAAKEWSRPRPVVPGRSDLGDLGPRGWWLSDVIQRVQRRWTDAQHDRAALRRLVVDLKGLRPWLTAHEQAVLTEVLDPRLLRPVDPVRDAAPEDGPPVGPLGRNLTPYESKVLVEAAAQLVREHGPPSGEVLLVEFEELAGALERVRLLDPDPLAERVFAVGVVVDGRGVVVMPRERYELLSRIGLLEAVLVHERTFHIGEVARARGHDEAEHAADAARLIRAIDQEAARSRVDRAGGEDPRLAATNPADPRLLGAGRPRAGADRAVR